MTAVLFESDDRVTVGWGGSVDKCGFASGVKGVCAGCPKRKTCFACLIAGCSDFVVVKEG